MSLPGWNELIKNAVNVQRLHGGERAYEYLMLENNKHGHKRCKGQIMFDKTTDEVIMTRCDRWECWRCADGTNGRLWQESQRVMLATYFLKWIGDIVYTVVVTFDHVPDVSEHEQQNLFKKSISGLVDKWQRKANANNQTLLWVLGHGVKQTNGVIHAHMVCNYLPEGVESGTPAHPDLMKSKWLQKRAKKNNLSLWIERVRNHDAVGKYIGKNLKETIDADIVEGFRRVRPSQFMPRLRRKHEISHLTKVWLRDYGKGQIFATIGNLEPIRIPHSLIDDAIKLGFTVTSSTEPITRENEVPRKSLSYIHTQASRFLFFDVVPTRPCCRCRKDYPASTAYFPKSSRNGDGLGGECWHCIEYERNRAGDFDRRIDKAVTHADIGAWCGRKLDKLEIKSRWVDDYCNCFYCEKPIHKDDEWELDHKKGTRMHNGLNVKDNIAITCPECHKLKTASGLDGNGYLRTIGKRPDGCEDTVQLPLLEDLR